MNDREAENILLAAKRYKHICVTIDLFCDFITDEMWRSIIDPMGEDDIVNGLFAKIGSTNIYVSRSCLSDTDPSHHIMVSNSKKVSVGPQEKLWSPLLKLENFDRLDELKVFW